MADRAYDAEQRVRLLLKQQHITPIIPSKRNRLNPQPYNEILYKERALIENFFQKLKQYRAIATRYDKTARNFRAAIYLAASCILLI